MTNYRNKFTVLTILLLLSLAVCGSLSAQNRADSKDVNTIRVSTAREFLEALGSNRTIVMEPGVYVLSDYDPSEQEGDEVSLPKGVQWRNQFDGVELVLTGIRNLTIRCEQKDNAHIIVHPRYAYVLRFINCTDIILENLLAGHSIGGYCNGGVFAFENSSRITLTGVNMYGCGMEGLMMDNVSDMSVNRSSIFECTYQIMTVSDCLNIAFTECSFVENREFSLFNVTNTVRMTFDRCAFINNVGTPMFNVSGPTIIVSNSYFLDNQNPGYGLPNVLLSECVFEASVYKSGKVLGDRVNMRVLPNTNAAVTRQLDKGMVVYMVKSQWAMTSVYRWYLVSYEGDLGWVYGEFLQFSLFSKEE